MPCGYDIIMRSGSKRTKESGFEHEFMCDKKANVHI